MEAWIHLGMAFVSYWRSDLQDFSEVMSVIRSGGEMVLTNEAKDAIELFRSVVSEKRYGQNFWHKRIDGKDYVCLAAALGEPGKIHSVDDCPANLLPRWVLELMPTIDDGIAEDELGWLFESFSQRLKTMILFSPQQWERIRTSFMIGVIDVALDAARPVQMTPLPDYWVKVEDACAQVKDALNGDGDLEAAEAAARAARAATGAAAWAAEAAARAARAAAGAAWAAWAARAAALAAAWAAAWATQVAAGAAAYKQIASVFFACVDAEKERDEHKD